MWSCFWRGTGGNWCWMHVGKVQANPRDTTADCWPSSAQGLPPLNACLHSKLMSWIVISPNPISTIMCRNYLCIVFGLVTAVSPTVYLTQNAHFVKIYNFKNVVWTHYVQSIFWICLFCRKIIWTFIFGIYLYFNERSCQHFLRIHQKHCRHTLHHTHNCRA